MLLRSTLLAGLLAVRDAYADGALPHSGANGQQQQTADVKRVAVIGAGAGGTSAAYHIRKFASDAGIPTNITIFERNTYIGGRSTTVQAYDDSEGEPIELGASIFVQVNHILVQAVQDFGLSADTAGRAGGALPAAEDPEELAEDIERTRRRADAPALGIWNGREFVLTLREGGGGWRRWWDAAKMTWRYGLAPYRTLKLVQKVVGTFLRMYEEPYFPWPSLSQVAYDLGLTAVTAATGEQYLRENEVGDLFAGELAQAMTRVNYAQNLGSIHGLEAMVSMATDGAMAVEGGNWQIFDEMARRATGDVRIGANVSSVERQHDGTYIVKGENCKAANAALPEQAADERFDSVVIATPLHFSGIGLTSEPEHTPDAVPYVELHVTLFTSPHLLSPAAFDLPPDNLVPEVIITTLQPDESPADEGPSRVGKAGFFSISLLRQVVNPRNVRLEFAYKIFSPVEVDAEFLSRILGVGKIEDDVLNVSESDVTWIYRKVWHSYPYEFPRVTFEELRLDANLWYTSGIESFISTMETSALMGKNIARLIVNGWAEPANNVIPVVGKAGLTEQQPLRTEL